MKKNEAISILATSVRPREPKDKARYDKAVKMSVDALKEPERKKGKWIPHEGGKFVGFPYMHYECSECRVFEPIETNFCPNCGAKMKGGEENE